MNYLSDRSIWLTAVLAMTSACIASAQPQALDALSLEELASVEVNPASHPPRQKAVPGAVFVLSQDDIRRSGATSIPQALRLVPGLQVAQVDASRWAISARGFNSRTSNRILVLIDGRSLYTPLTGGVFWSVQDTMIEEIDRIEVLRGPGGATWGSNAFNAVINIITKRASQTGGAVVSTELADDGSKMAAARFGDAEGDLKWRAFGKYSDGDAEQNRAGRSIGDTWEQARIGGRLQLSSSERTRLQLNFEAYTSNSGATIHDSNQLVTTLWPELSTVDIEERLEGGFAGARFTRELANGARLRIDASTQYYDMNGPLLNAHGVNGELNLQHIGPQWGRHRVTSGLMLRGAEDTVSDDGVWRTSRREISSWRASAFAQDELGFFDDRLLFTAGAKLEYSDVTGSDLMPSLRVHYAFENGSSVWSAASRGVRAPALTEHYGRLGGWPAFAPLTEFNPTPLPLQAEIWGDPDMDTEKVTAYELGARHQLAATLSVDVALYYNEYEGLRGVGSLLPIVCEPSGVLVAQNPACMLGSTHLLVPIEITNVYDTRAYGGELVLMYAPLATWKLIASYAHIGHHRNAAESPSVGVEYVGAFDPKHQLSLRSSISLGRRWDLDAQVRYVDELAGGSVPAYTELDVRAAWRPTQHFELAFTGSDLLHHRHHEFTSDFGELAPVWIQRKVSLQARWLY